MIRIIVLALLYLTPTVIAFYRQHHNLAPIVVVNLLTGWTVIGWVVALVWSLTSPVILKRP